MEDMIVKKRNPNSLVAIVLFCIVGMLSLTWTVQAVSSTLAIEIEQRPPFFSPRAASTLAGTVVEWKNRTGEPHSIRADDCIRGATCSFESRMIMPNAKFEVRDLKPGEYSYHCGIHPFMRGRLTVRGQIPRVHSEMI